MLIKSISYTFTWKLPILWLGLARSRTTQSKSAKHVYHSPLPDAKSWSTFATIWAIRIGNDKDSIAYFSILAILLVSLSSGDYPSLDIWLPRYFSQSNLHLSLLTVFISVGPILFYSLIPLWCGLRGIYRLDILLCCPLFLIRFSRWHFEKYELQF